MSNFTISIEVKAPGIVEALSNLAAVMVLNKGANTSSPSVGATKSIANESSAVEDTSKTEIKAPGEDTSESSEPTEPTVTIEQIRAKVKEKAKVDKPAVKKLLKEYEATSVTALDKSHYDEFYKKLGDL